MKPAALFALLTASAVLLSGCELTDLLHGESSETGLSDHSAQRYSVDRVRDRVTQLQEIWRSDDKRAETEQAVSDLVTAVDDASAVYLRAEMQYYADWDSDDLTALHTETAEDYYAVAAIVGWAMAHGAAKSRFPELFEPYCDPEWSDYYLSNTLTRVISDARADSESNHALLDEYYATARDDALSESETNEACAKLYLETLDTYDTSHYLYDQYARDYTVEDTAAVYREVVSDVVPIYTALTERVKNDPRAAAVKAERREENPFETVNRYAAQVSPALAESAEKLLSEQLYTFASGDSCYDGSYTVNMPHEQRAMIYLYRANDFYDFISGVHEFGHFHADWRDPTPTLLQKTCIDVAEIQSQGLEMIYTHFYPEIFGDSASYLELAELLNIVDSVVSGFAIGEFEYEVMQRGEQCTADDVLSIYDRISGECGLEIELYQISHLFENPGYYVSYGASALAALEIYTAMQTDFRQGADLYQKIASISSFTGEYRLREALAEVGMTDIFSAECIPQMIGALENRIEALS